MKKIAIKLILLSLIATVVSIGYVWQQATELPDEYIEAIGSNQDKQLSPPLQSSQITERATISKNKLTAPLDRAQVGQKVAVKLSDRDLNNLVVDKLAAGQINNQVPIGIKGINTNIKDGKIHTGALVNLGQLAAEGQSDRRMTALSKITTQLPFLKDRDVYVGIVGKPVVEGSRIEFDEDTQIKVGNMNFTISQLAESLGVPPEKIQQALNLQLQNKNLKVDRIDLENNQLGIEGAKQ